MRVGARDTTALAAGSAISGLLAYVFFVLATRTLGPVAAAPVSLLWTYWSFSAAALTFPLQHWIARSIAAHRGDEWSVQQTLPRVVVAVLLASLASGLLAWLGRDALFHRDDPWFPLLVAWVTIGSGFVGIVRGGLAARHRFISVAWALVAENLLRCVAAIGLIVASVRASLGYGICLAVGSLVGLVWPSSFRFSAQQTQPVRPPDSPLAFIGGAAGGQLIGQAVLTGGPVLLALSGGSPGEVTALFAGLALFRAPYTLALGLVSQLTGRLTRLVIEGKLSVLRKVRLVVVLGATGLVVAAGAFGAVAGPPLLRVIFGSQVSLEWSLAMLVAIGSTLALANLVVTITIMAQSRSGAVARAWVLGSLAGALVFAALAEPPLTRTCWTFVASEAVAFAALVVEEIRGSTRLAARFADGSEAVAGSR